MAMGILHTIDTILTVVQDHKEVSLLHYQKSSSGAVVAWQGLLYLGSMQLSATNHLGLNVKFTESFFVLWNPLFKQSCQVALVRELHINTFFLFVPDHSTAGEHLLADHRACLAEARNRYLTKTCLLKHRMKLFGGRELKVHSYSQTKNSWAPCQLHCPAPKHLVGQIFSCQNSTDGLQFQWTNHNPVYTLGSNSGPGNEG